MAEADFWDGIAEKYAKDPIKDMEAYKYTLERTRSYLGTEDEVLELGCGTGATALQLADAAGRIVATDISEGMLAVGRRNVGAQGVSNVEFLQTDAFGPALKGQRFDVVMIFNALHLVRDADAVLARCHGLLKPGGLLISKTPCLGDEPVIRRLMFRMVIPIMQLLGRAPYVTYLTAAQLEAMTCAVGFDVIERVILPSDSARPFLVARRD